MQSIDGIRTDLREEIRDFLAVRPDLTIQDLVKYTTLCSSAGRNFLNGHMPGSMDTLVQLRRALELAREGDVLPTPQQRAVLTEEHRKRVQRVARRREFYETETVKVVAKVCDYCAANATIGIVTGDFGVGKTDAVSAWRRAEGRRVDCIMFEFNTFTCGNAADFCRELAKQLSVDAAGGAAAFRAVVERLREEPALLIFDQCETTGVRVAQAIRQIWDATHEYGVGVVMLAAPVLMARMMGSRIADLGALTSRVGIWAQLTGLGRGEMAAIVKQEGIADVDERAFEVWSRACGGSMRRLMRSIDLLRAGHAGRRITEKTIVGVASHLWGMQLRGAE
ncbi:MAG: hypothetical protein HY873_02640 [Chloroflexi bacterium]|nr:hypothetical protein [Chloroflexota bacterium]